MMTNLDVLKKIEEKLDHNPTQFLKNHQKSSFKPKSVKILKNHVCVYI